MTPSENTTLRSPRVIFTRGSENEIGRQHAEQLKEESRQGMVAFYSSFWKRLMGSQPATGWSRHALELGKKMVDPLLVQQLQRQIPAHYRARLAGLAEAAGIPFEDIHLAVVLPDLLPILEACAYRIRPSQFVEVAPPLRFGCTSFVSRGDDFWVGRNLDFPGVGYWDKFPVIQLIERPGALRYVGFTTAGSPIAGITGVNEAQIWVGLHQHYCGSFKLSGQLPFITGEEILSTATTLSEAVAIARNAKMANGWAFVLADGKKREATIVERQPSSVGLNRLTPEKSVMAHSNYYQTSHCQLNEYAATARMNWDNYHRKERLEALVQAAGPKMTAATGAAILSDHVDTFWGEEKVLNRTVSQLYNIQSVLMDLGNMVAYLAEGEPPIHLGNYRKVDLGEIFAGRNPETSTVPGYRFKSPSMEKAKRVFVDGFVKCFDGDYPGSLAKVTEAVGTEFVPEMAFAQALLALREGELSLAKNTLLKAKTFIEEKVAAKGLKAFPPEYFEIALFAARALHLSGDGPGAHQIFDQIETHPSLTDAHIKRIAKQRRPFTMRQAQKIVIPFSSYIPFD